MSIGPGPVWRSQVFSRSPGRTWHGLVAPWAAPASDPGAARAGAGICRHGRLRRRPSVGLRRWPWRRRARARLVRRGRPAPRIGRTGLTTRIRPSTPDGPWRAITLQPWTQPSPQFGDGACDIAPLTGLVKRRVRAIAAYLGAPPAVVQKVPTADLEELRPSLPDEAAYGTRTSRSTTWKASRWRPKPWRSSGASTWPAGTSGSCRRTRHASRSEWPPRTPPAANRPHESRSASEAADALRRRPLVCSRCGAA